MSDTAPEPGEITSFATFIAQLEDGDLNADLSKLLQEIGAALSNHAIEHGGKPTARLSVGLAITLDSGVFQIKATKKVTLPDPPRRQTIMYGTASNRFSVRNPRQSELFGPREVKTV
ncbi:hypothetical protein FFK22_008970 [Mycobacterium sp. KBS0706]|uniref:hypothetical protein n=1 Tax=Mycobacterium sp. KBS0706 TaxID=2578109 RepID=UPI00110FBFF7|nr:hypothetical protein [Mycobacterium sp. KBS0706]TSD89101.1 hypothetical protein FFK22_008970 [Mycobacterium sp. KBS0706]